MYIFKCFLRFKSFFVIYTNIDMRVKYIYVIFHKNIVSEIIFATDKNRYRKKHRDRNTMFL